MKPVKKITISAIVIALYIAVMFVSQGFAFGQYQIRLATSLYSLSYVYPFLIVPLGLANFLSNTLMGGLGPLDMLGGIIAGIVTSGAVYLVRKFKLNLWLITLPIVLCPGLLVPVWLSRLLNVPYLPLALSLCAGQVLPAIGGVFIIRVACRYILRPGKNTHGL
ncbi:QueT transporter [Ruminiclostridium hungatei]|uniref:QueT transporter n=1 Tax=Ruminiclostridium hungatei TaxID=48256 RepID=A0A1V4SM32_RUMHU|nr:QueT transporter family protein [Ruminiclostridium hungatei]OPX44939.1 QueT transporter [Ruminiclostridium hungatei]